MGRVKEPALLIQEGPEIHMFLIDRGHMLAGHKISDHSYRPAQLLAQLFCGDITFLICVQQFKWRA